MEVKIYIDVLWMRMFLVELYVCIFVNLWMKQERSVLRILWMTALAVSAEVLLFAAAGYGTAFTLGSLLFRALLLYALFLPKRKGVFFRLFLWSMAATVAAGGILMVCQERLPRRYWFAAGISLCALAILVSVLLEERREQHDKRLHRIVLLHNGKSLELWGLYDTGNRLMDPYVHAPVSILAESAARELDLEPERCRLIPFSSVGAQDGLLPVWTIDGVEWTGGRWEHAVIGVTRDALFEKKDYQLILAAGWKSLS